MVLKQSRNREKFTKLVHVKLEFRILILELFAVTPESMRTLSGEVTGIKM